MRGGVGTQVYMARVEPTADAIADKSQWEFYAGGTGTDAKWTKGSVFDGHDLSFPVSLQLMMHSYRRPSRIVSVVKLSFVQSKPSVRYSVYSMCSLSHE